MMFRADRIRGKNTGTILVGRFLIGAAGSLGATLVGGTISDIYPPEEYVHTCVAALTVYTPIPTPLTYTDEDSPWLSLR
jgi:hypothetical protein